MLQGGQGDAGSHHIRAERVAKPMRVCGGNPAARAMVTEQRAESGGSHGLSSPRAFQANKQGRHIGRWPFQAEIGSEDLNDLCRQRQDALPVAFAENSHLGIGQFEILKLKGEDLARAQTIEQHQTHDRQIPEGAETVPESGDFFGRQRYDYTPGLL
jgi:hypothetical protein